MARGFTGGVLTNAYQGMGWWDSVDTARLVGHVIREAIGDSVRADMEDAELGIRLAGLDQMAFGLMAGVVDRAALTVVDDVCFELRAALRARVMEALAGMEPVEMRDIRETYFPRVPFAVGRAVAVLESILVESWTMDALRPWLAQGLRAALISELEDPVQEELTEEDLNEIRGQAHKCGYGQHDAGWLSFYAVFRELIPEVACLDGHFRLAKSCGWWWPFKGAVILTERPRQVHMVDGRLHRQGGPAVLYPDGFAVHALNGVRVPAWLAETPEEKIDPRKVLELDNAEVRREFVRKVGIDRVCYSLNAECVDKEGTYELLMLDLKDGRRRPYLKMLNPSIDTWHVEGVHPQCQTVREALNWRNGLTPDMIDDVNGADWHQQGDCVIRPRGATKFKSRPIILT